MSNAIISESPKETLSLVVGDTAESIDTGVGPKIGSVENQGPLDYRNLVQMPVKIGPAEIELDLYKCYDAGRPGFWGRAAFSLWISGVMTIITMIISFVGFCLDKSFEKIWRDFFTISNNIQLGSAVLFLVIGGLIEHVKANSKDAYINSVMKRYRSEENAK